MGWGPQGKERDSGLGTWPPCPARGRGSVPGEARVHTRVCDNHASHHSPGAAQSHTDGSWGPLLGVGWGEGAVVFEPRLPWLRRQPSRQWPAPQPAALWLYGRL